MLQPTVFSSSALPAGTRAGAWRGFLERAFTGMRVLDLDDDGPASANMIALGTGRIFALETPAKSAVRPACAQASVLHLMLVAQGCCRLRHVGHDVELGEGQFALVDDREPMEIALAEAGRHVLVEIPRALLQSELPWLRDVVGRASSPTAAADRHVSDTVRSLAAHAAAMAPEQRALAQRNLVALLPIVSAFAPERDRTKAAWLRRALASVELHAHDPRTDAHAIAEHLGVSRRYLDLVFAHAHTTAARELRERRLRRAANDLKAPPHADRSILEIALAAGFSDTSHFARAFRRRYGVSPGRWRASGRS